MADLNSINNNFLYQQQQQQLQNGNVSDDTLATETAEDPNTDTTPGSAKKAQAQVQAGIVPGLPQAQNAQTGMGTEGETAPPLPDVPGTGTTQQVAAQSAANYQSMFNSPMPITSLNEAFSVLSDIAGDTLMQYGKLKNMFNQDQISALQGSAAAQIAQVQGERESARNKLIGACVSVGASIAVGGAGAMLNLGSFSDRMAFAGGALNGVGAPLSQMINQYTTFLDTDATFGGTYKADQAKITKAVQDTFVQMYKTQEDTFNNEYENARKSVQNIMDMKRQSDDNTNQVNLALEQNI